MTDKKKSILFWVLAVIMTLVISVYQRLTGPTNPVRANETFAGCKINYKLLRTQVINENLPVELTITGAIDKAVISYRHYKADESWQEIEMVREGDKFKAEIPAESLTAAKVEYTILLVKGGENFLVNEGKSIVARFKGSVPTHFLIIHVLLMLFSIIFALRTGLEATQKDGRLGKLVPWTLSITFLGGMILGPIVQHFAFGDAWTGFPFGTDLTDNKTLIAVLFWVLAFLLYKKSRWWVVLATVVMIGVYLIPHSAMGSELDYKTGKMKNKYSMVAREHTSPYIPG